MSTAPGTEAEPGWTSRELPRRLLHAGAGLVIAAVALLLPRFVFLPVLLLAALVFLLVDTLRFRFPGFNRYFSRVFRLVIRDGETSRITAASYYALASAVIFVSFDTKIAALSLCFLAVGDPVSGIIGGRGVRALTIKKSLESSLGCFAACLAVGLAFYYLLEVAPLLLVVGAVVATAVECLPLPVNDNLTIPIFSGAVMTLVQVL